MIHINYLEDDDEAPTPKTRPSLPNAPPPPGSTPLPSRAAGASSWYVCATENCTHYGSVATGPSEPQHRVKWGRCRDCRGLGLDVEAEAPCNTCEGRGKVILKEWDDDPNPDCPYCHKAMMFMQQGMQPQGYPRMEMPHSEGQGEMSGEVGFGRTRKIS